MTSSMSSASPSELKFEIGHVLFVDIVGYSQLLINQQSEQLDILRKIVPGTEQFRTAMDDQGIYCCHHPLLSDRARPFVGVRDYRGRNQA